MEFACSHVACDWSPARAISSVSDTEHIYDNICENQQEKGPPPIPAPRLKRPRPASLTPLRPSAPPPPPPPLAAPLPVLPRIPTRASRSLRENRLNANVNVVSIFISKLVDVSQTAALENYHSPVVCGKCSAALSCLSSVQNHLWECEFCGRTNAVVDSGRRLCLSRLSGVRCDNVHLLGPSVEEYLNLDDSVVVFCVDISGSMSVTAKVPSNSDSPVYISRLKGIQDALQGALTSLLQQSPRRRVALVAFSNEVVVYGDGTGAPLTLSDWLLVDYDHIWQQGVAYSFPHCISETYHQLLQRVGDLREYGATCLGPAALVSVAIASRYPGSKVILCTDGKANIGLGELSRPPVDSHFYRKLALQALNSGVIVSVMTFEGTDCRLAEVGTLADTTGGRVNTVNIGTVASEIQSASEDNVLATGVTLTLLSADGVYFPYEEENDHKLVKEIGNVMEGQEITFQFAIKPEFNEKFLKRKTVPFQLQLSFKTGEGQRVTRIATEQRPVTASSRVAAGSLNLTVLGVHLAQLCARLMMEGRVEDAQRQLSAQQRLLQQISEQRPIKQEESFYSNWMDTMSTICSDIYTDSKTLSDEAAKAVYQLKRASRNSKEYKIKKDNTVR